MAKKDAPPRRDAEYPLSAVADSCFAVSLLSLDVKSPLPARKRGAKRAYIQHNGWRGEQSSLGRIRGFCASLEKANSALVLWPS